MGGYFAHAQEYNFLNYNVNEGLAQSQVRDIIQDRRGFLWVGTKGSGISQFDGLRFRNAGRYDGLAANEIFDLMEDSRGQIWITHRSAVTTYDGYEFRIIGERHGLRLTQAAHVEEDARGDIWIAGMADGVYRSHEGELTHFGLEDGLPEDSIGAVFRGQDGEVYFLGYRQMFRTTREEGFEVVTELPQRITNFEQIGLSYRDGKLLLAIGSVIYDFNAAKRMFTEKLSVPQIGPVASLFCDERGRIWMGGTSGMARLNGEDLLVFNDEFTTWSLGVTCIFQDFGGNIWIGTNGGGMSKFSGEAFVHYGERTLLEKKAVFSILEKEEGLYWVGTEKGLFELSGNEFQAVSIPGLAVPWVNHILMAKDGRIFVATEQGGFVYRDGRFSEVLTEEGNPVVSANYFSEDGLGNVWLAHDAGAMVVNGTTAKATPLGSNWKSVNVSAIEEDSKGNRWYLVRGGGIFRYFKGEWKQIGEDGDRTGANPLRMLEDRNGSVWFATYDGLLRYKDGDECVITSQEGLYGNTVYVIVEDRDGNLWAGTERGINRIAIDEHSDPLHIKSYGKREGFKGVETNRGAGLLDSGGDLWFGTIEGLTRYDPDEDLSDPRPPRIFIRSAQIQMKPVDWSKRSDSVSPWNLLPSTLALQPGESDIRIDFIGVTMSAPEKVRYKYRLLPDTVWSPLLSENYASFSNLDFGSYTFEVQAINMDGFAASEISRIGIYLPTPIIHTFWFQISLLAATFILVYVLVRVRLNSAERARQRLELTVQQRTEALEDANRVKSDFLAKMSHEIRTPMNGVIGMTDLLRRTQLNERQRKFVENIRISGQNLLALINDILDFSRIESGKLELENTPLELRSVIEEVLDILAFGAYSKGLELLYWVDHEIRGPIFGDPARLKQILVNLVGNAIKFSDKGQVTVMAVLVAKDENNAVIRISVKDSGIGIPMEKFGTLFKSFSQVDASTNRKYGGSGLGLAISYSLAKKMGGDMWVESDPGKGAEFFFTIKGGLSAPWKYLGKDHPAFELIGQKVGLAIANQAGLEIILKYLEHWEIEARVYESLEAITDAMVEGEPMDFLLLDTRLFTEHHLKAAHHLGDTCRKHGIHYGLLCEPAVAISLEESTNEFGWLLSKPLKRNDLLNALLHRRSATRSGVSLPEDDSKLALEMPLRILIAEDNPINMDVAQGMLRNLGYEPDMAENGLEVLKVVQEQDFDVILMDVQMPEMDGLETTRRLVAEYPRGERPLIVAMTANAMESDRQRCLEAGMDTFISKPFVMEELVELIQGIRAGRHPMPDAHAAYMAEELTARVEAGILPPAEPDPVIPPPEKEDRPIEPEPRSNGEALTSLDMLTEVSSGDTGFIRGILEKLVVKLPEAVEELREALRKEDWETVRATSHRTKSSAAYSGAADLKEKFRELEHMAREREGLELIPGKLDELGEYVDRVVVELQGHLQRL